MIVAITSVASGSDSGSAADGPTPANTAAAAGPATVPAVPATTAPASTGPAASPTATPSRTATATAPARSVPAPRPSSPAGPAAPPSAAKGHRPTAPHVFAVAVMDVKCTAGKRRTVTATVFVRYDGTAAGTLHLTWWRSATRSPYGSVSLGSPQTAQFPKGLQTYTFTDRLTFTADSAHPYVGLTVSTTPAAAAGNNSFGVGCG